jgi:hypothetical protein
MVLHPLVMDLDTSTLAQAVPTMVGAPVAVPSMVGLTIFQLYPLPDFPSEGDHFYYDRAVDLSQGGFAALVAYTAHFDHPLVVHDYPDIAAF